MKKLLIGLFILSSCKVSQPSIITPKIRKILTDEKTTYVYVWHGDSWLVASMDSLPNGWQKGKRITIYPKEKYSCNSPKNTFKRIGGFRTWN